VLRIHSLAIEGRQLFKKEGSMEPTEHPLDPPLGRSRRWRRKGG